MTSNRNLRFTPEARSDLREILRYTQRAWGLNQRTKYSSNMNIAIGHLIEFPELGHVRMTATSEVRVHELKEHVIVYRFTETEVVILRLMHQRMDIADLFVEFDQ